MVTQRRSQNVTLKELPHQGRKAHPSQPFSPSFEIISVEKREVGVVHAHPSKQFGHFNKLDKQGEGHFSLVYL